MKKALIKEQNREAIPADIEEDEEAVGPLKTAAPADEISFAWAQEKLAPEDAVGWVRDMQIQLAWTRYRDNAGKRPFVNFSEYKKHYNGYGWYRTSFIVEKDDLVKKFKSRDLVLLLGKIGQADAVYLNGRFIGGTGLRVDTARNEVLPDEQLYYDKIRFYPVPRELVRYGGPNVLAVRVFAKYAIAPGLSHDKYYLASAKKVERSQFWDDFKKTFVIVLTVLLGIFYLYWQMVFRELIEQQKKEKERLSKFFSPDVIDEILGGDLSLGGSEKPIATLFADIVGFTSFSESQSPGRVLDRLNDMFTRISDVIITYKATLDKYIKYSEVKEVTVKGKAIPLKIYIVEDVLPLEGPDKP